MKSQSILYGWKRRKRTLPDTPEKIIAKYRILFLQSSLGRDVLADLLAACNWCSDLEPDNEGQVARHNVAIHILRRCGILGEGTMEQIIMALASVVPMPTKEEE